ncbi:MAG TPA: hypothetical protein P5210_14405 [Draconibacterium sp.]|nr:hypothetical protein [Draconibacterium sp.]
MKKAAFYLPAFVFGLLLVIISGCTTTPVENCEQDEICTGKTVTACCNEDECYYEFNGVKYGNDAASMAKLATDLGCTQASAPNFKEEIGDLILRLEALGEIARLNQKSIGE